MSATQLKPRRQATDIEIEAMLALGRCRFTPASFDKRFAHNMSARVNAAEDSNADMMVTEREVACLWRKVHRYRRQITDTGVLHEAKQHPTEPNYERS